MSYRFVLVSRIALHLSSSNRYTDIPIYRSKSRKRAIFRGDVFEKSGKSDSRVVREAAFITQAGIVLRVTTLRHFGLPFCSVVCSPSRLDYDQRLSTIRDAIYDSFEMSETGDCGRDAEVVRSFLDRNHLFCVNGDREPFR